MEHFTISFVRADERTFLRAKRPIRFDFIWDIPHWSTSFTMDVSVRWWLWLVVIRCFNLTFFGTSSESTRRFFSRAGHRTHHKIFQKKSYVIKIEVRVWKTTILGKLNLLWVCSKSRFHAIPDELCEVSEVKQVSTLHCSTTATATTTKNLKTSHHDDDGENPERVKLCNFHFQSYYSRLHNNTRANPNSAHRQQCRTDQTSL